MMLRDQPRLRRLILIGTPLLTGILLLFHPRPDPANQLGELDVFTVLSTVADRFLAVHVLFAPALALLGLSVILLLYDVRGTAARISRVSAFVFIVTYMMYETINGLVPALLARGAIHLPPDDQAVIGDAIGRIIGDPILGDPSVLFGAAWLSWIVAVTLAAFALRRSGKPLVPCILLGLSCIFVSHASLLGLVGLVLFLFAVVGIERAGSPVVMSRENELKPISNYTNLEAIDD
jgi:hypothetical protein